MNSGHRAVPPQVKTPPPPPLAAFSSQFCCRLNEAGCYILGGISHTDRMSVVGSLPERHIKLCNGVLTFRLTGERGLLVANLSSRYARAATTPNTRTSSCII